MFFVWALAPFFVFGLFSAVCSAVSAGETQVWLGDLRVVVFGVVVVFVLLFYRFAYSKDFFVLVQSFVCLLTCKDRAISATSATLEEKKLTGASLMRGRLLGIGSGCTRHPSKKYIPDKGRIF